MPRRLLLISNSTNHGEGYLDHVLAEIDGFLGPVRRLVFVPFALKDREAYGAKARERLAAIGVEVATLTADEAGLRLAARSRGVLHRRRQHLPAAQDPPGLGAPAHPARAGPRRHSLPGVERRDQHRRHRRSAPPTTCRSSEPASFKALGLVPFQLNPHYLDPDPGSTHMGETREQRLREFHEENETPVVGLREGAWLRVEGDRATLGGTRGARIFRRGTGAGGAGRGESLDDLL